MSARGEEASDHRRWAEAESAAIREPLDDAEQHPRDQQTITWTLIASSALLIIAAAVLLAPFFTKGGWGAGATRPSWEGEVGIATVVCGAAVVAIALVLLVRTKALGLRGKTAMAVLTRRQRTQVWRQVTGRRALEPEHLNLARQAALGMVRTRGVSLVYVGLLVAAVGRVLEEPVRSRVALAASTAISCTTLVVLLEFYAHRSRRFLLRHPRAASGS